MKRALFVIVWVIVWFTLTGLNVYFLMPLIGNWTYLISIIIGLFFGGFLGWKNAEWSIERRYK